jgi:hypothetical protein
MEMPADADYHGPQGKLKGLKMMIITQPASLALLAILAISLTACERQAAAPEPATAQIPAGLLLADAPAGAKDVAVIVSEARHGDEVVIRGRVGGHAEPFAADRAVLQLIDPGIKACSELPGDGCTTPWDVCCEPRDNLLAGSVSIQVVDADGRPLRGGLRGVGGLQPLSTVIVTGRAVRPEGARTITINATGLHIVSQP